jgi:hypothetical protein
MIHDLSNQKGRNEYAKSDAERKTPRQYGYYSSAVRFIKNHEAKHGKRNFVINQLDADCFEVIDMTEALHRLDKAINK